MSSQLGFRDVDADAACGYCISVMDLCVYVIWFLKLSEQMLLIILNTSMEMAIWRAIHAVK